MRVIKTKAKTIFTKTSLGPAYTINQYVGCQHRCTYCYARFMARFKDYGPWGTWVEAKINAPELVKGKKTEGSVWMSSVSDPYQPLEKDLELTRKVLTNMDKSTDLSVQTKSNLILRDIDLFKKFEKIEIGLTVNGFGKKAKKLFEPSAPSHEKRIETLKKLKQEEVATYAFISPIIPGLVDIKALLEQTSSFVEYYWFEILNLKGAGKGFSRSLETNFPKSYKMMKNKNELEKFISKTKREIKKAGVESRGVVTH